MTGFKDLFTFSKKERGGIIALFILMVLSMIFYFSIDFFYQPERYNYSDFEKEIEYFESTENRKKEPLTTNPKQFINNKSNQKTNQSLFYFDPNFLSADSLELLGIFPNIVQRIVKYRNAGGKFTKPEDLKKVYGVSDKLYLKLEPFINIKSDEKAIYSSNDSNKPGKERKTLKINLNTADTTQLKSLNGIGSKLSSRIVKFRDNAGGFYSLDQLSDIYGLKPETINLIKDQIYIDDAYRKININSASAEELKKHPYIYKWNIANAIVNYRTKHGNYKQASDLMKTDLVTEDLCRKIAPYLIFE